VSVHRSKAREEPGEPGKWPVRRPTRAELLDAYDTTIPDLVAPGLRVLLVGINPSLYSGWSGHHFARPGNRLWRSLADSGFTERVLHPSETGALTAAGLGVTNLVARATARADELGPEEIKAGVTPLRRLVLGCRRRWGGPTHVAFLGVSAFRIAFDSPAAQIGPQPQPFAGAAVWVLPNPSGLNAHYQQPALTAAYAELRAAVDLP
jgi:TDG/mug DNA glycosylase family protein